MISHTIPDNPCTDTKIIPDFPFVGSYRKKSGYFPAISVKERNCVTPPLIFKSGSSHIAGIGFCHFSSQCEQVFK